MLVKDRMSRHPITVTTDVHIDEALKTLKGQGVALIDENPRQGAHGRSIAFLHPAGTGGVLIELVQKS